MKKNSQFEHADGPYGRGSVSNIMFFVGIVSSLLLSNFGLVKFFKNGPTHFLQSSGPAAGFASPKALLTFFSVFFTNTTKVFILMGLIGGRAAEKLLYSLNTVGPGQHQQLTLCTTLYNFHEYVFNKTDSIHDTIVFYGSTGHPFQGHDQPHGETYLAWNVTAGMWTCTTGIINSHRACISSSPYPGEEASDCTSNFYNSMTALPGNFLLSSTFFANLVLWAFFTLLPPLLLSLCLLSWSGPRLLPRLLLLHPQLLLTPVFSHFCPGPTPGWGTSRLSHSVSFTWLNIIIQLLPISVLLVFFMPWLGPNISSIFFDTSVDVSKDHKLTSGWGLLFLSLSYVFTLLALHLPWLDPPEVRLPACPHPPPGGSGGHCLPSGEVESQPAGGADQTSQPGLALEILPQK